MAVPPEIADALEVLAVMDDRDGPVTLAELADELGWPLQRVMFALLPAGVS